VPGGGPAPRRGLFDAAVQVALAPGGVVADEAGGVALGGLGHEDPDRAGLITKDEVGLFHGGVHELDVCGEFARHGRGADAEAGQGDAGDGAEQLAQGVIAALAVEARTAQRHTSRRVAAALPTHSRLAGPTSCAACRLAVREPSQSEPLSTGFAA
jgi:hypothetical protein